MISVKLNLSGLRDIVTRAKMFKQGEYEDRLKRVMAVSLIPVLRNRIHVEGKKSDSSTIGTYSNSYLNYRQKKPFNRTSESKVVLSLTRQMENDLSVVDDGKGSYGIGFKNKAIYNPAGEILDTEIKVRKEIARRATAKKQGRKQGKIRTVSNLQKALWMEEKYGDIYNPTKSENEMLQKVAEKFIKDIKLSL